METSAILALPFIQPAQAQKHVTHNEALALLDQLVQPVVISRQQTVPPALPEPGDRYIVPALADGAFAGQTGRIALWDNGYWQFLTPRAGWRVEVRDEECSLLFDGTDWLGPEAMVQRAAALGIGTSADATNRLAVAGDATLLTHAGTGHQLKLNKAAAGDKSSVLFQTGWSGRAEMGTVGEEDFSIKTSADGTSFHTALRALASSGLVELPAGLLAAAGNAAQPAMAFSASPNTGLFSPASGQIGLSCGGAAQAVLSAAGLALNVPLTGLAVRQSATDRTVGRLARVGDPGIGAGVALTGATPLHERDLPPGNYSYYAPTVPGGPESTAWGHVLQVMETGGVARNRIYLSCRAPSTAAAGTSRAWIGWQGNDLVTPILWQPLAVGAFLVGTVSQSAGLPTGAVLEYGANANCSYLRLADGTQYCWQAEGLALACDGVLGAGFATPTEGIWTFPAAFASTAVILTASPLTANRWASARRSSASQGLVRHYAFESSASAITTSLTAIGRWF